MIVASLSPEDVERVVQQACRAPSLHNTQPWRFTSDGTWIDLYADLRRGLPATDPNGRELVISCGAALYNLRLGLRGLGLDYSLSEFPDHDNPRWLARVEVTGRRATTLAERSALRALTRRHTHRTGFDDKPLDPALAVLLQRAAQVEGAALEFVHDPGSRRRVVQLSNLAAINAEADLGIQAELGEWTPASGSTRRDGVPATAYPADETLSNEELAPRGFGRGRGQGVSATESPASGVVGVLTTETDRAADWLRAGQALSRLLNVGAEDWLFASLDSQVTESTARRADLRRELRSGANPQLLLCFGYATTAQRTPRRSAADIVSLIDPAAESRPE